MGNVDSVKCVTCGVYWECEVCAFVITQNRIRLLSGESCSNSNCSYGNNVQKTKILLRLRVITINMKELLVRYQLMSLFSLLID